MAVRPFNEFEVQKAAALKSWRTAIRLKHSLRADAEIASELPQIEAMIDNAITTGEPLILDPATAFTENL